jgi:hypothetical protein
VWRTDEIVDFQGGLDLVSALSNVPPSFSPNAKNFRVSEYGGIEKIRGCTAHATLSASAHDMRYYQKRDGSTQRLIVATATKWISVDNSGTSTDIRTGMTSTTESSFVVYEDSLYGLDPLNDLHSWSGTGSTSAVAGSPPRGIILGVWQNALWVAESTSGAVKMKVRWSDPGNFASWPAANFVELGGEGSSDKLIGGVPTADGLCVFAGRSTYLIYDTDGSNNLVDSEHGCSSRNSLSVVGGKIYGVNSEGVFATDGRFPLEIVSRRVDPLFKSETPTLSSAGGTRWGDSYLVSYRRSGSSSNNLTLDVFDGSGSIMANDYPALCWASGPLSGADDRLYYIDAASPTYIRRAFNSGKFLTGASTAQNISCYYETAPLTLGDEAHLKRITRVRVVGRGDLYVGVRKDYGLSDSDSGHFVFPSLSSALWDTATWDSSTWGGYQLFEGFARIQARARRIGLRFFESSQNEYPARSALGGDFGTLGGAAVHLAEPEFAISSRRR